jgi:hypothetical protein
MYKSVSFNIYELNLQDIVYKNRDKKTSREAETSNRKLSDKNDIPIPKPIDEFWKKPLSYNKNKSSN